MGLNRRELLKAGALAGLAMGSRGARAAERFYTREAWSRVMLADPGELDLSVPATRIEGAIPGELFGARYLLNGPARLVRDGVMVHPLDGHGYLRAFRFLPDGGVSLRARFVRTSVFEADEREGRLTERGFGTLVADPSARSGRRANRDAPYGRNAANTTVVPWGGRLLCGYEGGLPHALDPDTLETHGLQQLGDDAPRRVLAHMKVDAERGWLATLDPGGGDTPARLLCFDRSMALRSELAFELQGFPMLHDFALTPRWLVLTSNPLELKLSHLVGMARGRRSLLDIPQGLGDAPPELILVPRDGGPTLRLPLDRPVLSIHQANAFDTPDGRLVLDTCSVPGLGFGKEFGFVGPTEALDPWAVDDQWGQVLLRVVADPATGRVEVKAHDKPVMDFPRVHPARDGLRCRHMVAGGRTARGYSFPYDAVLGVDLDDPERPESAWVPGGGRFVGEPVWIPPAGSDEDGVGWVVVMTYDGERDECALCVLDPDALEAGPVARVPLPLMPHGFHGHGVAAD